MSQASTPTELTERYNAVRGAFTAQGSSLHQWCKSHGVNHQNARKALIGQWQGPKASALVEQILKASGFRKMNAFMDANAFSDVSGLSARHARRILGEASKGEVFQGCQLEVLATSGQGGAGGRQYLVALSSLPAEMQERAKSLDLPLRAPFDRLSHGEIAEWQREEAKFRLHVISPAINTTPRSSERAQALKQIAKCTHRDRNGAAKTVSERTARIWLDAYEEKGLSGLVPKASPVRGARRVLISRRWDAEIDLDNTARATVASELEQYGRDGTAAGWSTRTVARQCGQKLAELSKKHGSQLSRQKLTAICALTKKWASRFDEFRRVDRFRHDNKAWDDRDKPRILRKLSDKPMDVVFGDVHADRH